MAGHEETPAGDHQVYTDEDGVVRVQVGPHLDLYSAPWVKERTLKELRNPNLSAISIDLTSTEFIDSTGLGYMTGTYKRAKSQELPLTTKLSRNVYRVFQITGLENMITVESVTIADAIPDPAALNIDMSDLENWPTTDEPDL